MRVLLPTVLLGLVLVLIAGCGGGDKPKPATGPGLPSQAALKSYFEAITGSDPDALATVQKDVTADGSLAQGYAAYVAEAAVAASNGGSSDDGVDVEEVDGGFKACIGDSEDQCATWSDLVGKDGKLVDFTVNGRKLDELLVDLTGQRPIRAAGLYEVQPDWAYRQPTSGRLLVICTVTASDVPLSPRPGTYIEEAQILKGTKSPGPATVKAGSSSPIILTFTGAKDVKLDGQVTFDLQVGDQGTESIGFGLADPAP